MALAVRVGGSLYAVLVPSVEEVLPALPIEPVPDCPPFVRGVLFMRGQLIPVVDAAELLGIAASQRPLEWHLVCLRAGERLFGLQVDEALDLVDLTRGVRLPAEKIGTRHGFLAAAVDLDGKVFRVLNADGLVAESLWNSVET